jgi:hypothetical protein
MRTILIIAAATLMTALQPTASAADPKSNAKASTKKSEAKAKSDNYPLYAKVAAVTARTLTIVRSDSPDAPQTKFSITAATEIVNGDKGATIDDVKVGRWIGGSAKKGEGDANDTVLKINVGAKQKEPAGKEDAKPAKKPEAKATTTKKKAA